MNNFLWINDILFIIFIEDLLINIKNINILKELK